MISFCCFYRGGLKKMPVSKAQQKAVHKYVKANYDRLELTMPKGRKAEIKAYAESQGESVNGFLNRLIAEAMAHEGGEKGKN